MSGVIETLASGQPWDSDYKRYGMVEAQTNGDGDRWLSCKTGGCADSFGDQYLALSCAVFALRGALTACGIADAGIGGRVAIVLPHVVFEGVRDAIAAEDKGGGDMFKGPRRKTVDPRRLATMLGGVVIASEFAEGFSIPEGRAPCPHRRPKR